MIKTKVYYAINAATLVLMIVGVIGVLIIFKTPVRASVSQHSIIECGLINENEIIKSYDRGFDAGYIAAYADIIEEAGKLNYNPKYVAPERKPK